ncbi:MAG: amino acid ABC transporter permease [Dehalococcoidia bacterium]|nr:amino acid ABC transporter permease [Dehalococcoidia bacterium]
MAATLQQRPPSLPPPRSETGAVGWMRANLFSTWYNALLTVVLVIILVVALWYGGRWALVDADWSVVGVLGGQMVIGQYNIESSCPGQNCFWRPQASLLLVTVLLGMGWAVAGGGVAKRIALGAAIVSAAFALLPYGLDEMGMDVRLLLVANLPAVFAGWALGRYTPVGTPKWVAILAVVFFLLTLVLLRGIEGVPGMQPVSVIHWGGITLNILLAVAGITLSLPIGIALALGRRSNLPIVKLLCVVFIEVFRGVPLITLLFMSQVLVPLAFPEDLKPNSLLRAAIVITLFSAAYMAENIRGGLQALHPGQEEAARALGLPGWQTTLFISLPQAIRNVIPAIVGQFIALFKDTSLVYIIGMLDIVEISRAFIQGNTEYLSSAKELFIFLALVFWVFTYTMSYVSGRVERYLGVGQR